MAERIRRVCLSKVHGTHHAYRQFKCKCPETMAFMALVQKEGRARRLAGISGVVDATATQRRIKALFAAGWTGQELAERLGKTRRESVKDIMLNPRVLRSTEVKIEALYDALQNVPGPSKLNRMRSTHKGWAPPMAWDDDTITDPQAQPNVTGGMRHPGRRMYRSPKETLYEYQTIREAGMSHEYALEEMGINNDGLMRATRRAG